MMWMAYGEGWMRGEMGSGEVVMDGLGMSGLEGLGTWIEGTRRGLTRRGV